MHVKSLYFFLNYTLCDGYGEEIPSGGDLYVLKEILHDWSDEEAISILRNCRRAMSPQSKMLVSSLSCQESRGRLPGRAP
ncbi:MAG: hypothetical protein JOZ18_19260 [Chloroflexi bacterium]|nr:hypothetical protein [Chloroflexota bacterium]